MWMTDIVLKSFGMKAEFGYIAYETNSHELWIEFDVCDMVMLIYNFLITSEVPTGMNVKGEILVMESRDHSCSKIYS